MPWAKNLDFERRCQMCGKAGHNVQWRFDKKYCTLFFHIVCKQCWYVGRYLNKKTINNLSSDKNKYERSMITEAQEACRVQGSKRRRNSPEVKESFSRSFRKWLSDPKNREIMSMTQKQGWANKPFEEKLIWRKSRSGPKSATWKGGLSKLTDMIRQCKRYKEWRKAVYEKNGEFCDECNDIERLNVHHIFPLKMIIEIMEIKTIEQAIDCEDLWNVDIGMVLCEKCHTNTHKDEREFESKRISYPVHVV